MSQEPYLEVTLGYGRGVANQSLAAAEQVRTAEVIASLSLATDLGIVVPLEHGLQSTLLAMRLADGMGVDPETASQTYYACLLFYVGCTANADVAAESFGGHESLTTYGMPARFGSRPEMVRGLMRASAPPGNGPVVRGTELAQGLPKLTKLFKVQIAAACSRWARRSAAGCAQDSSLTARRSSASSPRTSWPRASSGFLASSARGVGCRCSRTAASSKRRTSSGARARGTRRRLREPRVSALSVLQTAHYDRRVTSNTRKRRLGHPFGGEGARYQSYDRRVVRARPAQPHEHGDCALSASCVSWWSVGPARGQTRGRERELERGIGRNVTMKSGIVRERTSAPRSQCAERGSPRPPPLTSDDSIA